MVKPAEFLIINMKKERLRDPKNAANIARKIKKGQKLYLGLPTFNPISFKLAADKEIVSKINAAVIAFGKNIIALRRKLDIKWK